MNAGVKKRRWPCSETWSRGTPSPSGNCFWAIRDADFLKIDLSLVKLIAPACREVLFSFTDENRDISKRLLIFRRRSMNGSSVVDNGN